MKSEKKKLTLFIFCWLFGVLGVHRFYTGKYLTGTLQILLISCGFPVIVFKLDSLRSLASDAVILLVIWLLFDTIRIVAGRFTDNRGQRITQWV